MNGREEGGQSYITQTCDQEQFEARKVVFSWECLNIFATGCSFSLPEWQAVKMILFPASCTFISSAKACVLVFYGCLSYSS